MSSDLRVNAYVMAADPSWVEESIASYYDLVDRIVVSYDRSSTSWTGAPIAVEESLLRLKSADPDGKMVLSPGDFHDPSWAHSLDGDTYQRNKALAEASEGADWVIQLDTDEVVGDLAEFRACLLEADRRGFHGMDYPARNLMQYAGDGRYLERSGRWWGVAAGYPGPVAVRANTSLVMCRQAHVPLYRVDFKARNTDPAHPRTAPVHRVVQQDQGIFHFSWVRSDEFMVAKSRWSGHASDFDWEPVIEQWRRMRRSPYLAALGTPARRGRTGFPVRVTRLPQAPGHEALLRNGLLP